MSSSSHDRELLVWGGFIEMEEGRWKKFVNVPLELIHTKLNGESRRREIIPHSDSSAKKRIILIVRRALDLSFDIVWMSGPGKTCLSVERPQRGYQITNFTRAFTVEISVEQRQTSYISSMAQRGEWTGCSTISDKTNCLILHTVEKLQIATRCSSPYI